MMYLANYQQYILNIFISFIIIKFFLIINKFLVKIIYFYYKVKIKYCKKKLKKIKFFKKLIWIIQLRNNLTSFFNQKYLKVINYYKKMQTESYKQIKHFKLNYLINKNLHKKIKINYIKLKKKSTIWTKVLFKPILNNLIKKNHISKFYIRKTQFFSKTKFSWIRQECKNIVHLTLLLNTIFIFIVFQKCMGWEFLLNSNFIFIIVINFYLSPYVFKINCIIKFYRQFYPKRENAELDIDKC